MNRGNIQPRWNVYEAVILLDALIRVRIKEQPRATMINEVSSALRQMAVNQGYVIDDPFRDISGISYQFMSMESALKGVTVHVPSTKLFTEVASLFIENRYQFNALLEKAWQLVKGKNNKEKFFEWASTVLPAGQFNWLDSNMSSIEQYAQSTGLIDGSIYDVKDKRILLRVKESCLKVLFQTPKGGRRKEKGRGQTGKM